MIMSKKAISYLVFFGLLLSGFYYAMVKYTDFEEVKLPVLNTVQPFEFLRQDSAMASQKDIRNRIYVAEYFFTTCKGICPKMNKNMKAIYEQFKTDSK
jgi:protein SCO1/2